MSSSVARITRKPHNRTLTIFCCLCLWLDLSLAALRFTSGFVDDVMFSHNGSLCGAYFLSVDRILPAEISTKFILLDDKDQQVGPYLSRELRTGRGRSLLTVIALFK